MTDLTTSYLDHGIGRNPDTGEGRCVACDWTGPFYMADSHLAEVKRRWEAANRRANERRARAVRS